MFFSLWEAYRDHAMGKNNVLRFGTRFPIYKDFYFSFFAVGGEISHGAGGMNCPITRIVGLLALGLRVVHAF